MKYSTLAKNDLVRVFVRRAVLSMAEKNISKEDRHMLHSDLVPRFSEKVVQEHMKRGPQVFKSIEAKRFAPIKQQLARPLPVPKSPLDKPPKLLPQSQKVPVAVPPVSTPMPQSPPKAAPKQKPVFQGKYASLTPLISDPSVVAIECSGPNTPVVVFRMGGQKQVTKITLDADQIRKLLTTFSEDAHVPLMEGVFRVMVEGLSVNAVISELIGSKFVIKKNQNPQAK